MFGRVCGCGHSMSEHGEWGCLAVVDEYRNWGLEASDSAGSHTTLCSCSRAAEPEPHGGSEGEGHRRGGSSRPSLRRPARPLSPPTPAPPPEDAAPAPMPTPPPTGGGPRRRFPLDPDPSCPVCASPVDRGDFFCETCGSDLPSRP